MGKKIEVTQQQRQEIIRLYQEEGIGMSAIGEKIGQPWGFKLIKRVLEEEGIELRPNNGSGRKKLEVPRQLQLKIIEAYQKGWGLDKIVKELELPFSFDKVKSILKDNGIHIRNVQEAHEVMTIKDLRKFPINDNYNLLSHNGAWLMGFIAADGYLPATKGARNRITISLAEKDREILEQIAKELEYEGNIYEYVVNLNGKTYNEVSLTFASKQIRTQLENYGIVNNKTFKLDKIPDIPDEYKIDFIAGVFDGDGSIGYTNPKDRKYIRPFWSITAGNKEFLESIQKFLINKYNLPKENHIYTEKEVYTLRYSSVKDILKLCSLFYDNNYLRLERKKQKYLSIREQLPRDSTSL